MVQYLQQVQTMI